jgi:hypothetical protein
MRLSSSLQAFVLIVVTLSTSFAQNQSDSVVFPTTPPTTGRIIAEDEFIFSVRHYDPPAAVQPVSRDKASFRTPESAAVALISAMAAFDFDWFRSIWDAGSLKVMDAQMIEMKQDRNFWTNTWEKTFRGKRVELIDRIDSGNYVLINYRVVGTAGQADPIELISAFKFQDGRWFATQDLSSDPVALYWKAPNMRPKRIVRGLKDAAK